MTFLAPWGPCSGVRLKRPNESGNRIGGLIERSCWKAPAVFATLGLPERFRRTPEGAKPLVGRQSVPHRATGTSLPRQPLEAIPCLLRRGRSSPRRKRWQKTVASAVKPGVRKDSVHRAFFLHSFTLASRCSLIQLRLLFQGLGAACHKPYKPSKAIAGPGVPAGLWPDCWGCGCWPGWRSRRLRVRRSKSTRPRRWAAGSRWRRWSLRPGRWRRPCAGCPSRRRMASRPRCRSHVSI